MQLIHENKLKVSASLTDVNIQMGLVGMLSVIQDNMCEYFKLISSDGLVMIPACNSFFVVTKTKIRFQNYLTWLDEFKVKSELSSKSKIRVNLSTDLVDINNNIVAECIQEMCPIDSNTRRLRTIESTLFPTDIEVTKNTDIEFRKFSFDMQENNLKKTCKIECQNLDFYKHTNNIEYVRFMISLLDLKFLLNNKIEDFEIHYISESRYGDTLDLYMDDSEKGIIKFEIRKENNTIVKACLRYSLNKDNV